MTHNNTDSRKLLNCGRHELLIVDSITEIRPEDRHRFVVSGSHGGISAARFVVECPVRLAVFNDAGIGKNNAGIAGLDLLQRNNVAALAVSAATAMIGCAEDSLKNGIISACNEEALKLGFTLDVPLSDQLAYVIGVPSATFALGVLNMDS